MKRKLSLIIAVVMCVLTLASCGKADEFVPAGFKKASNDNADYTLYVPEGWTVDMSTGVTTAYASDRSSVSFIGFELDDTVIRFDPVTSEGGENTEENTGENTEENTGENTEENTGENTEENTEESAEESTGDEKDIVTLDDYWDYYSGTFEETFSDMEYLTRGESTVVSGIEARKYVYKATVTGVEYTFLQVVAIKDLTVYIFTYTAKTAAYETNLEEVTEIIGYLEIK